MSWKVCGIDKKITIQHRICGVNDKNTKKVQYLVLVDKIKKSSKNA